LSPRHFFTNRQFPINFNVFGDPKTAIKFKQVTDFSSQTGSYIAGRRGEHRSRNDKNADGGNRGNKASVHIFYP
jgi:hypothetical protein